MVGLGPGDVPASAPVKFVGAGTAACIADLITFPLDTAKVRLQVNKAPVNPEKLTMICFADNGFLPWPPPG